VNTPTAGTAPTVAEDWWRNAVVYQIYPRSFADSNADGTGDLAGVTSRLPHLARLGADALWISPFYPSPLADGGYDVADYRNVDPRFGKLSDFKVLAEETHRHGLKLIVDLVPNHSSDQHLWFREALMAGPGSAARDRYIFRDGSGPNGDEPPSDWQSHFGGSAWTRLPDGQWYLHLFAPEQPDLNWDNPDVRADFLTTLRFWSDLGVDGFRVDVAHGLVKDMSEPLRSQPNRDRLLPDDGSDPLYDRDGVHEIYAEWRQLFNEYTPPRMAVAESWAPAARRPLYAKADGLGQAFNFDLVNARWDCTQFRTIINSALDDAARCNASSTWVLSNHDIVRHASRFALPNETDLDAWLQSDGVFPQEDRATGLARARAATMLMLALPGSAYLYQGEELGLFEVADLDEEVLEDPIWTRTGHRLKGRDGCRVPLPWTDSGTSFGFGAGGSWLPQPAWFGKLAAFSQEGHKGSTLELYRNAISLRRDLQSPSGVEWVETPGALHFRRGQWESVTNFGSAPIPLPPGTVRLSSNPALDQHLHAIPPDTTLWLTTDPNAVEN
jgi:alpha-glucosidase